MLNHPRLFTCYNVQVTNLVPVVSLVLLTVSEVGVGITTVPPSVGSPAVGSGVGGGLVASGVLLVPVTGLLAPAGIES